MVPKLLFQTYKHKKVPEIVKERWLNLNPDYTYHLYSDKDCYKFLKKHFSEKYAKFFKNIKDGPIKSDFWRICILYVYGGIYADIDIVPLKSIATILNQETTFYTCISDKNVYPHDMNPHFIASTPKNPLLKQAIQVFYDKRETEYSYQGWSITTIIYNIMKEYLGTSDFDEGIYQKDDQVIQFSQEIYPLPIGDIRKCYIEQDGEKIMMCRDGNLYNEHEHEFYMDKEIKKNKPKSKKKQIYNRARFYIRK